MIMTDTAKIFMTGRSQAVRLPQRYRFSEKEVFIRRDEKTGEVILSPRPQGWSALFACLENLTVPEGFPGEREQPGLDRDPTRGTGE
jgi:antitoxin VapB